jgi:hypothetical protein
MGVGKKSLFQTTFADALVEFGLERFSGIDKNKRIAKLAVFIDAAHVLYVKRGCNSFPEIARLFFRSLEYTLGGTPMKDVSQLFLSFDLPHRPSLERGLVAIDRAKTDDYIEKGLQEIGDEYANRVQKVMECRDPVKLDDNSMWPGDKGYSLLFSFRGFKTKVLTPYLRYRADVDPEIKKLLFKWAQTTKIVTRGLVSEYPPDGTPQFPPYSERARDESYGCVEVFKLAANGFVRTTEYDHKVKMGAVESDTPPFALLHHVVTADERPDILLIGNDGDTAVTSILWAGLAVNSVKPLSHLKGIYFRVASMIPDHFKKNELLMKKNTFDLKLCYNILDAKATKLIAQCYFDSSFTPAEVQKQIRSFTKNFIFLFVFFMTLGGNDYAECIPKISPEDWMAGLESYIKEKGRCVRVPHNILQLSEESPGYLHLIEFERLCFLPPDEKQQCMESLKLTDADTPLFAEPYINRYALVHLAGEVLRTKYPKFSFVPDWRGAVPENRRANPNELPVSYILRVVNNAIYSMIYFASEILPHAPPADMIMSNPELSGFSYTNKLVRKPTVDTAINLQYQAEKWINRKRIISQQQQPEDETLSHYFNGMDNPTNKKQKQKQ